MINYKQLVGKNIRLRPFFQTSFYSNYTLGRPLGKVTDASHGILEVIGVHPQYNILTDHALWMNIKDYQYGNEGVWVAYVSGAFEDEHGNLLDVDYSDGIAKDKEDSFFSWMPDFGKIFGTFKTIGVIAIIIGTLYLINKFVGRRKHI